MSSKYLERKERFERSFQEKLKNISFRRTSTVFAPSSTISKQINHTRNKCIEYNKIIGNFCENCDGYNKYKEENMVFRNPFHDEKKCSFINKNEQFYYSEHKIIKTKAQAEYPIFPLPRNWFF